MEDKRIPGRVDISGCIYQILPLDADQNADLGRSVHGAGKIFLEQSQPSPQMADTLFHEMVHICDYHTGSGLEEKQVQGITCTMFGALMHSPGLLEYLLSVRDEINGAFSE